MDKNFVLDKSIMIDFSDEALAERFLLAKERIGDFEESKASQLFLCCKNILCEAVYEKTSGTVCEKTSGTVCEKTSGTIREKASGTVCKKASGTIREKTSEKENTGDYEIDFEKDNGAFFSLFLFEFGNLKKLYFEDRIRETVSLMETLIQLENALEEKAESAEIRDIIYSYFYDYTEEFTDYFALNFTKKQAEGSYGNAASSGKTPDDSGNAASSGKTLADSGKTPADSGRKRHGLLHVTDALTPFGIVSNEMTGETLIDYAKLLAPVFGDRLKAEKLRALKAAVKKYGPNAYLEMKEEFKFAANSEFFTAHQNNLLKRFMEEAQDICRK